MNQPTLNQYREAIDRIQALKNERDEICMDNTPPWTEEVLDKLDEVKYWIYAEENRLLRMREMDREQKWHGG